MEVKFKKMHKNAKSPYRASKNAAGFDLYAMAISHYALVDTGLLRTGNGLAGTKTIIDTGIAVEIPEGYVGYLFPRSSITKQSCYVQNSVGVIDSDYRGSIKLVLQTNFSPEGHSNEEHRYDIDDRIAQLIIMPIPDITFTEVKELSETERGDGGYGSTGRR